MGSFPLRDFLTLFFILVNPSTLFKRFPQKALTFILGRIVCSNMSKTEPSLRKKAFFGTVIIGLAFLAVTIVKTSPKGDFYFLQNTKISNALFVESSKNFIEGKDSLSFIEGSSVAAVSSPLIFTESVSLGMGGTASGEEEKDVIQYIVKEGDTVSLIAEKFGVSVNTVLWENDLNSKSVLKTGKELVFPPVSGVIYEVRKGDTVSGIAEKHKAKAGDIVSFNELPDEESIYIGDILVVPGGRPPVKVSSPSVQSSFAGFIVPAKGIVTQGLHWYNAVDIANSCGSQIYASAGGTVQRTGYHAVGGRYVRILHPNGMVTYYGHLSRIAVAPGQSVAQGALIGYMGNTGYTIGRTGCHIHFEVRGGKNPLAAYRVGHRF